jgi:hypothetical protein
MPTSEESNAYGFTGLTSLVSDFKQPSAPTPASSSNSSPAADATARPLLRHALRRQAGTTVSAVSPGTGEGHRLETTPVLPAVQGRDYGRGPIVLVVIVAILGFIVYANLNDGSSNGTRATASLPSPVTPRVAATVNVASSAVDPAAEAFEETEPLPGSDNVLVLNEIKYCLAQDSRISTVQPLLDHYSHAAIEAYNAIVADFNSRCSQYRYKESDMAQATAAVKAHQAEIDSQAQQWLASWQGLPKRGRGHSNMNASTTAPDNN